MKTKIRKTPRYLLIEEETFKTLKTLIKENNKIHRKGKKHLKLDIAVFFIHYISYMCLKRKDSLEHGYVPLMASILKKQHSNSNNYLNFLFDNGFIDKTGYSAKKNKARRFKVLHPTSKTTNRRKFIKYKPSDYCFNKNLNKDYAKKSKKANNSCPHLTKWLSSENLVVEYGKALDYIHSMKEVESKKISRIFAIEMLKNEIIHYQRNGKDNRLHSNLTNLPKDLRRFVKFKGNQQLYSFDIKSSQPLLLAGILNLVINKDVDKVKKLCSWVINSNLRNRIYLHLSTMMQKSFEHQTIKGIREFIHLTTKDDIYSYISDNFSEEFLCKIKTPIGISDKVYCKNSERKIIKHFKTIRDYSKMVMLEYLYCSKNLNEGRNNEVRAILPESLNDMVDNLKSTKKEDFPIFLQNIESKLILDIITKEISKEFPNAPLYTIHDSIATTKEYKDVARTKILDTLTSFFGIDVNIEMEEWR